MRCVIARPPCRGTRARSCNGRSSPSVTVRMTPAGTARWTGASRDANSRSRCRHAPHGVGMPRDPSAITSDLGDPPTARRDHDADGGRLGALALGVGGVLHVRAGMDAALLVAQGGADRDTASTGRRRARGRRGRRRRGRRRTSAGRLPVRSRRIGPTRASHCSATTRPGARWRRGSRRNPCPRSPPVVRSRGPTPRTPSSMPVWASLTRGLVDAGRCAALRSPSAGRVPSLLHGVEGTDEEVRPTWVSRAASDPAGRAESSDSDAQDGISVEVFFDAGADGDVDSGAGGSVRPDLRDPGPIRGSTASTSPVGASSRRGLRWYARVRGRRV